MGGSAWERPVRRIRYFIILDLSEALTFTIEDLKGNWRGYKRRFGEDG